MAFKLKNGEDWVMKLESHIAGAFGPHHVKFKNDKLVRQVGINMQKKWKTQKTKQWKLHRRLKSLFSGEESLSKKFLFQKKNNFC